MSQRVLITGATGFVGRQVLRALEGHEITAVLREGSVAPEACAHVLRTPDLFAQDIDFWTSACAGIDIVIHLAWYAEPGLYQTSLKNLDCLAGTLRLSRGAVAAGVKRFVGIGTCFEYDLACPTLSQGQRLSVSAPLGPSSPYGAAKAATWLALSRGLAAEPTSFAWARLFYLYGEAEDPRRLAAYLHLQLAAGEPALLTSGRQVRDFLDVREAGRQIAQLALGSASGAFNICSGRPVTVASFAADIAAHYGRPDLVRLGARPDSPLDPPFVVGEPSIAREEEMT